MRKTLLAATCLIGVSSFGLQALADQGPKPPQDVIIVSPVPVPVGIDQTGDNNKVEVIDLPAVKIDPLNNKVNVIDLPAVKIDPLNNKVNVIGLPLVKIDPGGNGVSANITGGSVGISSAANTVKIDPGSNGVDVNITGGSVGFTGVVEVKNDPSQALKVEINKPADAYMLSFSDVAEDTEPRVTIEINVPVDSQIVGATAVLENAGGTPADSCLVNLSYPGYAPPPVGLRHFFRYVGKPHNTFYSPIPSLPFAANEKIWFEVFPANGTCQVSVLLQMIPN